MEGKQEMLIMETRRKILNRHRKGEGIRGISRDLNISRNTVRDIIRNNGGSSTSYTRKHQPYPKLECYIELLEKLLRDNQHARPKRNAKQLHDELCLAGYEGSYSSTCRYISKWKARSSNISPLACVPLSFAPGEAYQFDWSTDKLLINNEIVTVKVAHFILCYSGRKFIYIYPNETQEMVFDAHIRAFEYFGGTPLRGIYDNMSTAVKKVLRGKERDWNPNFERMCAHYRVDPTACTPARGNEKGRVERQVRVSREQFFTPMPQGKSIKEINDILASQLATYNATHKHPEYKDKTLNEVFEQERRYLLATKLPFDGCKQVDMKVSITCLMRFDRNDYSVHCSCAGKIVQCKSYADKLVFIYEGKEVGCHERKFTKGKAYYNWHHYLPLLAQKPGALRNGAPFSDMELPDELNKVRAHLQKSPNGIRDFAHILSYIPIEGLEQVCLACAIAIKERAISKDIILNILLRSKDSKRSMAEENITYLALKHTPEAEPNAYNHLLTGASL